jgi:rhodanese-related sulfurtransferase
MIHSQGFLKVVDDAKTRVREITVEEVRSRQERNHEFVLVDVREDSEWNQDRAAGSIHLGRGVIERDIENAIPAKDTDIVLYCGGGYRSALAADMLQRMGYTNVRSMAGGMRAWRHHGYPLEKP